jgi:4-amino-4-deoxy-L-arabinose transferase-like glycosyltransferase
MITGSRDDGRMFGFEQLAQEPLLRPYFLWNVGSNALAHTSYLGIFLLVCVIALLTRPRVVEGRILLSGLVLTGLAAGVIQAYSHRMSLPLGINMINEFGLGPQSLHGEENLPRIGIGIWWLLTLLGLFAGFTMIGALLNAGWKQRREFRRRPDCLLLALIPLIYLPPIVAFSRSFDRYLLPMLPPLIAMLLLLAKESRARLSTRTVLQALILVLMGLYSLIGTRDYLEHHRCRWAVLDQLVASGIDPSDIDGGFEFRSTHDFQKSARLGWGQDVEYRFLVSHEEELDGYRVVSRHSWRRLFPAGEQVLTVFEIDN